MTGFIIGLGLLAAGLIIYWNERELMNKYYPDDQNSNCRVCHAKSGHFCARDCPDEAYRPENAPICFDGLHHHCALTPHCGTRRQMANGEAYCKHAQPEIMPS